MFKRLKNLILDYSGKRTRSMSECRPENKEGNLVHGLKIPVPDLISYSDHDAENPSPNEIPTLVTSGIIPRITGHVLVDILNGVYDNLFSELYIIDCRYEYEYNGGHIKGALNINDPRMLYESFFRTVYKNAIFVFHCEFSHNRGPQLASIFRTFDRELNKKSYPSLFYERVYILEGGYRKFYNDFINFTTGSYTLMMDQRYISSGDLSKATAKYREGIDFINKHQRNLANISNYVSKHMFKSPVFCSKTVYPDRVSELLSSPIKRN